MRSERALDGRSAANRACWAVEGGEHSVTDRSDNPAPERTDQAVDSFVVLVEN
jgi:hypothetical protein